MMINLRLYIQIT